MSESDVLALFDQVGFTPPPNVSLQDAFRMLLELAQQQQAEAERAARPPRGRTAVHPSEPTAQAAAGVLAKYGASVAPIPASPVGCEVTGVDVAAAEGGLPQDLAGALEVLMAVHGFVLLRGQGRPQNESGVAGTYLTAEQQCRLSECFGAGALHSTHGVHPEAPCRDIFRLSNDPDHGFNSVGPEWHNDGSFCREVFGHVVYHIVKAPAGGGDTRFAHLGVAHDQLSAALQRRLGRCASVNSNGGAVHPLAAPHPLSGRPSLYLHLGMTGAMLEVLPSADGGGASCGGGEGGVPLCAPVAPEGLPRAKPAEAARLGLAPQVVAWRDGEMDPFFSAFSSLLDDPRVSYSHRWREGDVIIIDNLAVAHKAAPSAHTLASGLRILHRTTVLSSRPHDPPAHLGLPHTLPTAAACPFERGATWREGYVGFRWGAWEERSVPH